MIAIGDTTYARGRAAGFTKGERWQKSTFLGDDDALHALSPERLLSMLRSASRETERIGEEDVRGEPTVRYRMTVNCEEAELSCPDETAPVEVWIDRDGLVRRIWLEDNGTVGTIEFFDFGVEVHIEPPPAYQVEEFGEGSTPAVCDVGETRPIRESQAIKALRRQGFTVSRDGQVCSGNVAAVLTNSTETAADEMLAREGIVFCWVFRRPPGDAPNQVKRRGTDGGDAELRLENLQCTILADSPSGEEKVNRLEGAFEELERAIRP